MLFKNGVSYTLTDADREKLKEDFGHPHKKATVKYSEQMWVEDKVNKKNVAPATLPVLLNSTIQEDGLAVNWMYCRTPVYDKNNPGRMMPFGNPKYLTIKRRTYVEDAELLFFLAYKSPQREGSTVSNGQKTSFVIEQRAKEAAAKIDHKLRWTRKSHLILDHENGLDYESVKALCEAFFVAIEEGDTESLMRIELDQAVNNKENLDIFFRLIQNEEGELMKRSAVARAFREKIIVFDAQSNTLNWMDSDGNVVDKVKKVTDVGRYREDAYKHFSSHALAWKKLENVLKERGYGLNKVDVNLVKN